MNIRSGSLVIFLFLFCFEDCIAYLHVQWSAPFFSSGGYCSEALSYTQALDAVKFYNFTIIQHGDSWNADFVAKQSKTDRELLKRYHRKLVHGDSGTISIQVCHSEPGAWYVPYPNYHTSPCPICDKRDARCFKVGRTMFETDTLPNGWRNRLEYMDEIWVPTNHSKKIFIGAGIAQSKLRVVEETVDTDFFQPLGRSYDPLKPYLKYTELDSNLFVFLFVGKFEKRKGIDVLLKAYFNRFTLKDQVILLILTSTYHSSENFHEQVLSILSQENILINDLSPRYLILNNLPQDVLPWLYSFVNVLVIPSFGEGWGRPHMEAMSCGTPVIATNWSGPIAFITPRNGYLIPIEKMVPADGWPGHKWALPNITELQRIMAHVVKHPADVLEKGGQARMDVVRHFSLRVLGRKLVEEFRRIERLVSRRIHGNSVTEEL